MENITGRVVGKGCVGECGQSATVEYRVDAKASVLMVVQTVETSLCPNTGAHAWIFINGRLADHGVITRLGSRVVEEAAPGDEVVVQVATFQIPNGTVCVRLGELNFSLIQQDFVSKAQTK